MSEEKSLIDQENEIINKWGSMIVRALKGNASRMTHGKEGKVIIKKTDREELKLADSVRYHTKKDSGIINKLTFSFERHGVFVQKGVGRGQGVKSGFVIRRPDQVSDRISGKERHPNDWFNGEIGRKLPELADKLQEINADMVLDATKMMIK